MPEPRAYATLEEYAEHIRIEMAYLLSRLTFGHTQDASRLVAELGTEAANLVHQNRMQQEVSAPDRYDLAALPALAQLTPEDDEENPFREE